ncbi:Spliceosomal protein FBP11/Splicing factor PRP40 [Phaffia rhodozyma]|uniref:Spliceosomal protein FBP11/Splicing factor PRP40 n=1 Tax=Phaffia rhodozyma TaxID=264483 RepID=A0A0F7SSH0_PHARH|nr:Spliceosomal protein FBP11/Splicing factor PRP40 [Phaffia rhodozyma]
MDASPSPVPTTPATPATPAAVGVASEASPAGAVTPGGAAVPSYTEHTNAEGRMYWYDTVNKVSVWEKPDALKTPFERAMAQTAWKEYVAKGRKYWVNKVTKESVWTMPEELLLLLERVSASLAPPPPPPVKVMNFPPPAVQMPSPSPSAAAVPIKPSVGMSPADSIPAPRAPVADKYVIPDGGWPTQEEAEEAFRYLLKKAGVDIGSTWDVTMRAIITDPLYKSLGSLAEKKAVFTKFIAETKARKTEEKEARLERLRPQYKKLLSETPSVKPYSTFRTVDRLLQDSSVWKQTQEEERKSLFDEFISELRNRESADLRETRRQNIAKLTSLFKSLDLTVSSRWREAEELVLGSNEWRSDAYLRSVEPLEILVLFEERMKELELEHDIEIRKKKSERLREARKARESFKNLLLELVAKKILTAKSKWKKTLPRFAEDERYLALLGKPGSTPLEMFQDVVDDLDQRLEHLSGDVRDVFARSGFVFDLETSFEAFEQALEKAKSTDLDIPRMEEDEDRLVFELIHDKLAYRAAEEARRAERKRRHLMDDLRYEMKKIEPPLDLEATYEDAIPRLQTIKLFNELTDEEDRKYTYSKFVKRQKEKIREQAEEDLNSRKDRSVDHSREYRDRDRRRPDLESHRSRDAPMDYFDGVPSTATHTSDRRKDRSSTRDREKDKDRDVDDRASKRAKITVPSNPDDLEDGEI